LRWLALAAALAATAAVAVRARGLPHPSSALDVLRRAGRPLARIPLEFGLLVAQLRGRPHGAFRTIELPRGDWRVRSRRGLGAMVGSLPPNVVVVDIDPERGVALVHELVPRRDRPL
jgi:hypothetical protein